MDLELERLNLHSEIMHESITAQQQFSYNCLAVQAETKQVWANPESEQT